MGVGRISRAHQSRLYGTKGEKMPQSKSNREVILEIGCEGGGATVFRSVTGNGIVYVVESTSMGLDENDDEEWHSWSDPPRTSLGEAVESIARDDEWILFHPISIHPDHCSEVWSLVNAASKRLVERRPDLANGLKRRAERWQRVCNVKETSRE